MATHATGSGVETGVRHKTSDMVHEHWNARILLLRGLNTELVHRLASIRVVMPFFFISLGAPTLFAGIIMPITVGAQSAGKVLFAPLIASAPLHKTYIVFGTLVTTVGLAIIASSAAHLTLTVLTVFLLIVVTVMGIVQGLTKLAYYALLPALLSKDKRTGLLNAQQVFGGLLAVLVALIAKYYFQDDHPTADHVALIWAGVLFAFLAACLAIPIRETRRMLPENPVPDRIGTNKKQSSISRREQFRITLKHDWFRRFVLVQLLFLSIVETLPFYSMHAASLHKDAPGSLSTFVISIGLGVLAAGPIMNRLSAKSLRTTMYFSTFLAIAAAVLALLLELTGTFTSQYYYAAVFFLMAAAAMGGSTSIKVYIGEMAPPTECTYYYATASLIVSSIGIPSALALAFAAHFQNESVPIAVILAGNVAAIAAVYWLPSESTAEKFSNARTVS